MTFHSKGLAIFLVLVSASTSHAFTTGPTSSSFSLSSSKPSTTELKIGAALESLFGGSTKQAISSGNNRFCKARDLVQFLIEKEQCYSSETGAKAFSEACADNVIYEDCFEPEPFVGKAVRANHQHLFPF